MTSRSLQDFLESGDHLARLSTHAQRLLQIQRSLEAALPASLVPHVRVANFRLGKLFIHAANGAVAAKVRQLGPSLASELSNKGPKVTQIEVKAQGGIPRPKAQKRVRPDLPGSRQKQALTDLRGTLPEGSRLKTALERLLQTVKE